MNYLHNEFDLNEDDTVEVILDGRANILLMDDENFALYREGKKYQYQGGYAKESPVYLPAPSAGHWHLVIDLGGYPGRVRATARISGAVT